jgi:CRP/FNR family transcriptional regulator, cyclic AMP receptor protein
MDAESVKSSSQMMSIAERLGFLKSVPIFQVDNEAVLTELASSLQEVDFPVNFPIMRQGEEGHSLYLLVAGRVKVHLDELTLAELDAGACFGEMAVFDTQPRSASVTTLAATKCFILTQPQIYRAMTTSPAIAINLIRILGARIRKLNSLFGASEDLFYFKLKSQGV